MLAKRIFYGSVMIGGLVLIFWGDIQIAEGAKAHEAARYLQYGSIIPLVVLLLACFGALEFLNLARAAGYRPIGWVVVLGVAALNLIAWWAPAVWAESSPGAFECQMIVLVLLTLVSGIVQVLRHRSAGGLGEIAVTVMALVYAGILPSFLTALRAALPGSTGAWAVLLLVAVVKGADIGAYFVGQMFGKTKLVPSISPNKTVEGLAGGMLCALAISVLLVRYLPWPGTAVTGAIDFYQAVVLGAVLAVLGQFGDLVESILKRDAAAKDSSSSIPAFGGILDLLDSPVFAAPVGYILLKAWLS